MKNKTISVLILLCICFYSCSNNNESHLIQEVHENYKREILNDRGDNAVKYLDSNTIKWYSDILFHIKNASRTDIERMNIIEKFTVLLVRGLASENQILSFDANSLIVFAINNGLIDKSSVQQQSIDNIIINDKYASADMLFNGKNSNVKCEFRKEDKQWKLDLISVVNSSMVQLSFNQVLDQFMESNDSINNKMEAIQFILQMTPNVDINKIWETVK